MSYGWRPSLTVATIITVAFGIHNVGEGFATAALLAGAMGSAPLFTIAIRNITEGFAIGPVLADSGAIGAFHEPYRCKRFIQAERRV